MTGHEGFGVTAIYAALDRLRRRWQVAGLVQALVLSINLGLCIYCLSILCRGVGFGEFPVWTAPACALLAVVLGAAIIALRTPDRMIIARQADRRMALAEKLSSALEHSAPSGPIAEALLADASLTASNLEAAHFTPLVSRATRWGLAALAMLSVIAVVASQLYVPRTPLSPAAAAVLEVTPAPETPTLPTAGDVAEAAERIGADAEQRDDTVLADVAASMKDLAERMESSDDANEMMGEVADLLDRAASRYQSPVHDFPPFIDEQGLADRMASAQQQNQLGAGKSASTVSSDMQVSDTPVDPSANITTVPMPSGGEGESLGIKPEGAPGDPMDNQSNEEDGDSEAFGEATKSGTGQSNMTGTGSEPPAGAQPAMTMTARPTEAMALTAKEAVDGGRTRISDTVEAEASVIVDTAYKKNWLRQPSAPVVRERVPAAAAGAVARYFAHDPNAAEPSPQ